MPVILLILGFLLATPASRADIGRPRARTDRRTRLLYARGPCVRLLSNICQDGSPIRKLCRPGEVARVVSKYSPLSEHEDHDLAIVPFEDYRHGLASADLAPMIGTPKPLRAIVRIGGIP